MNSPEDGKELETYLKKLSNTQIQLLDEQNMYYLRRIPFKIAKECLDALFFSGTPLPTHVPSYLHRIISRRIDLYKLNILSYRKYQELKKAREIEEQFLTNFHSLQDPIQSPRRQPIEFETQLESTQISQKVIESDSDSMDLNELDQIQMDSECTQLTQGFEGLKRKLDDSSNQSLIFGATDTQDEKTLNVSFSPQYPDTKRLKKEIEDLKMEQLDLNDKLKAILKSIQ